MTQVKKQNRQVHRESAADSSFFQAKEKAHMENFMLEVEMGFLVMINAQNRPETYKELFDSFNGLWKDKCDQYNKKEGKKNRYVKAEHKYFRDTYGPTESVGEGSVLNKVASKIREKFNL